MKKTRRAIVSIEIIVAIGLMLTFIGVIASLGRSFGSLNRNSWQRHTCLTAAQAQLDAVTVLGHPIDEAKFRELWPGVRYLIETTDGLGQWEGLERVEVRVSSVSRGKTVDLALTRYIARDRKVHP
jgi:hypothetical protein